MLGEIHEYGRRELRTSHCSRPGNTGGQSRLRLSSAHHFTTPAAEFRRSVIRYMKLRDLGFEQWAEAHSTELRHEGCGFARISAVDRGAYLIMNEAGEVPAELTGRLAYQIESSIDLPCVGDWVTAQY